MRPEFVDELKDIQVRRLLKYLIEKLNDSDRLFSPKGWMYDLGMIGNEYECEKDLIRKKN